VRGRRPSPLDDGGETRVRVAAGDAQAVRRGWEHMFVMHDLELRQRALDLIAAGVNDCEVGRRLGVARTTVRQWRWAKERNVAPRALCWRCWRPTRRIELTAADYAELLGLYLGDGHISPMPRSERLRLSLDAKYPTIVAESEALLRRGFPDCRVGRAVADGGSTVVLWVYHRHLSCLFPQHGPGRKHERAIELEPWQYELVGSAPWAFVRGCIPSDGCSFINRTGRYSYLSFELRNWSADILGIFAATCVGVGLHPRRYADRVRLCRRADVAELMAHVGVKS
jgi:Homeodomain-like domain